MEFTFFCDSEDIPCILRKMDACEVLPFPRLEEGFSHHGGSCKIVYADDTIFLELRQWAAAAFACGLIESPRIERM